LSCIRSYPRSKDLLFEKALEDKIFQVLPEASAMDGLVPLTVKVRTVIFYSAECGSYGVGLGRLTQGWSLMALKSFSLDPQ